MGRPLGSVNKDKRFKAALIRYADADPKRLDLLAEKLWLQALEGKLDAMRELADRLDGKPLQESTVTFDDKRDGTDWTRDELVAILNDRRTSSNGAAKTNGRDREPDSVH